MGASVIRKPTFVSTLLDLSEVCRALDQIEKLDGQLLVGQGPGCKARVRNSIKDRGFLMRRDIPADSEDIVNQWLTLGEITALLNSDL
jgi:hypothetical protein